MAVAPPFTIAETLPAPSDLISQYPALEQTYRDTVESWLTFLSDPATGLLKATAFPSTGSVSFGGLTLNSTDAAATPGPVLELYRNSASPAAADLLGQVLYTGEDAAGDKVTYATEFATLTSPVNGAEAGALTFQALVAGVLTTHLGISAGVTTVTGALTTSGAATVGGVFSSPGMTDNAVAKRLQLADTTLTLGATAADFTVVKPDTAGGLVLSGGTSFATGGAIALYGSTHATSAHDIVFSSNNVTRGFWDQSAAAWFLNTGKLALGTANRVDIAGVADSQVTTITGGLSIASGVSLGLYGPTHATNPNQFYIFYNGQNRYAYIEGSATHAWYNSGGVVMSNVSGNLSCVGTVTASDFIIPSDAALKYDVVAHPGGAAAIVSSITPKSYRLNATDEERLGFIANDFDGYAGLGATSGDHRALSPMALIATLWQNVRELNAKVGM